MASKTHDLYNSREIRARIPARLHDQISKIAAEQYTSVAEILRRLIREYVEEYIDKENRHK